MIKAKWTLVLSTLLTLCNSISYGQSKGQMKSYISSNKIFSISYPATWKENKLESANAEFCINAPGAGLLNLCMIKIEFNKIAEGYENADIRQLSEAELKILQAQSENETRLEILESSFTNWNDHTWWEIQGKVVSGRKVYFTNSYKTIHNQKVYVFTYFSNEKNYLSNKNAAENIIASVQFLTKNTVASGIGGNPQIKNDTLSSITNKETTKTTFPAQIDLPKTVSPKNPKTYVPKTEIDVMKEAEYINEYGEGKIRRLSEKSVEVTLSTGNKKILKEGQDAKTKQYEQVGYYIGYTNVWNSFIFTMIGGDVKLINRTTGEVSDYIDLSDIEQEDTVVSDSYSHKYYRVWSPGRKWLAVEKNAGFEEDEENEAIKLIIYSVQKTFKTKYKKIFTVLTFNNSNVKTEHWEPGELKWLDDNTLEIKKVRRIGGFDKEQGVGTTWLTLLNGNWILTNAKPKMQKTDTGTKVKVVESISPPNSNEVLPHVKPKTLLGGKNPGELGRVLLTAVKNNDAKTWFNCVLEGDLEKSKRDIIAIREKLEQDGVSDWNLVKFSRAKYSDCCTYGQPNDNMKYELFQIEFTYGTQFLGIIKAQGLDGGVVSLIGGKYVLQQSINASGMFRK